MSSIPAVSEPAVRLSSEARGSSAAVHRFCWVLCGATFLLLVLGALVTGFGVGMAVPDWPTTFGQNMFTFPMGDAPWSVRLEHGHRLAGAFVGLLTLILAVWLWVSDKRPLVRGLGLGALLAVMVQGVLGGLRVVQIDSRWGVVHGALAQAFFALTVTFLFLTRPEPGTNQARTRYEPGTNLVRLAWITAALVYLQIVTGSLLRHTGTGLWLHLVLAVGVLVHVFLLNQRVLHGSQKAPPISALALTCGGIAAAQIFLGALSWMSAHAGQELAPHRGSVFQAVVTTGHVAAGALLFGFSVFLALRIQSPSGLAAKEERA